MQNFKNLFRDLPAVIGMIHVKALPGTPKSKHKIQEIIDAVKKEVEIYARAEIDGIMIENMHDVPYLNKNIGPEIVATMTRIGGEIRNMLPTTPLGIQILAGANEEALSVALATNLNFIRAEGFVFGHLGDEGYIESCAGRLLRYRKKIGAENIDIYTDIKKKHSSHAITNDISEGETARAAEFFLSDGVIVTGEATGTEANLGDVQEVKKSISIPTLIGSGITLGNVSKYVDFADGLIIGSYFKQNNFWNDQLSLEKIQEFMNKIKSLRLRNS